MRPQRERVSATAEHLSNLIKIAPVAFVELAADGSLLTVNDRWTAITGQTPEQASGHGWARAVHPEDAERVLSAWQVAVEAGTELEIALRFVTPSGVVRWVEARTSPLRSDGVVTGHLGTLTDVTAERTALAEVLTVSHQLQAVLDNTPALIARSDRSLTITMANRAYDEWFQLSPGGARGRRFRDLMDEPIFALNEPHMRKALAGEVQSFDRTVVNASGVEHHVRATYLPDFGDGEVVGFFLHIVDVTEARRNEHALAQALADIEVQHGELVEAQRLGQLGSFEYDHASGEWSATDQLCALWGLPPGGLTDDEVLQQTVPADLGRASSAWSTALQRSGRHEIEFRIERADSGAERLLRCTLLTECDAAGVPVKVHGTFIDITDVTAARQSAEQATAFRDAVLRASPDYTFVTDLASGRVVYGSPGKEVLGVTPEHLEALGAELIGTLVHPDDQARIRALNVEAAQLAPGQVLQLRYRARHADGSWHWLSRRVTPFRNADDGTVIEVLGVMRDITDVVEVETALSHAAMHDSLTGLPNRALLIERLDGAIARAGRDHRDITVLFCDLDGFKRVNDSGGHAAGDAVLLEIARRLKAVLREGDTVARIGGDEFVVVLEPWDRPDRVSTERDREDGSLAAKLAGRITAAVRRPIRVDDATYVVSASIGITHASPGVPCAERAATSQELLHQADVAMYQAKAKGKDRYEVFESAMRADVAERVRVEEVLREALNQPPPVDAHRGGVPLPRSGAARLVAHYQPVFCGATGELLSFEALARLTGRDGLLIPPDVFIATAEDCNLIRPLGKRMLELACSQLAAWRREHPGLATTTVAVNVSALQAEHDTLADEVRSALARAGLEPCDLVLELTETALMHADDVTISSLQALRKDGVGIAIDDFGVGYASLRYLATLPVSAVKVDRSFTAGLPHDEVSVKIVRAVAGLAADLDLICVVEGVETAVQLEALPDGVQVQGYLTGRPLPAEALDLHALLQRSAHSAGVVLP